MGVDDMTRFDASTMAWMVRDHEERVSHLTYLGEDLAVGGWDGGYESTMLMEVSCSM